MPARLWKRPICRFPPIWRRVSTTHRMAWRRRSVLPRRRAWSAAGHAPVDEERWLLYQLVHLWDRARRGTITAVAQALSYSPSAVSQQLATLEKEAGVRLIEPVGRRVRLTPQGDLLVAQLGHVRLAL